MTIHSLLSRVTGRVPVAEISPLVAGGNLSAYDPRQLLCGTDGKGWRGPALLYLSMHFVRNYVHVAHKYNILFLFYIRRAVNGIVWVHFLAGALGFFSSLICVWWFWDLISLLSTGVSWWFPGENRRATTPFQLMKLRICGCFTLILYLRPHYTETDKGMPSAYLM